MDMQQAITAKRKNETPTELIPTGAVDRLDALGQLLYGEQWITPMARDLKLHPDMIAEWPGAGVNYCQIIPSSRRWLSWSSITRKASLKRARSWTCTKPKERHHCSRRWLAKCGAAETRASRCAGPH